MHRPKQFAQMESEAERRRKTRSLRASLLTRGWLRENKQNRLTSWATERDGERARETRRKKVLVKWQNGQSELGAREAVVENWTGEHQRKKDTATPEPRICLFTENTEWWFNRKILTVKTEDNCGWEHEDLCFHFTFYFIEICILISLRYFQR